MTAEGWTAESVADDLRERITAGELEPGQVIDKVALSREYVVRPAVISAALRILTDLRLVARRSGVGLVVREAPPPHPALYRQLLAEAARLLATYERGRHPRVGELERWRERARAAGVDDV